MRRFYAAAENFDGQKIFLSVEETKHLRDVLRLKEKDSVRVSTATAGNLRAKSNESKRNKPF